MTSNNQADLDNLYRANHEQDSKISDLQRIVAVDREQLKFVASNLHGLDSLLTTMTELELNVTTNTELLSATPGIATGGKALILHSSGDVGIGTTGAPDTKLHVVGNIQANNIKSFYQTVNNQKNDVADTSNTTTQVTNSGCPSNASDWFRYTGWKTSGNDTINTDAAIFEPKSTGFQAKVAGIYKINVHMAFQTAKQFQNVAIRLAKNNLVDDVNDTDNENPGPMASTGYIIGATGGISGRSQSFASAQITHIMTLAVDDEISVYTVNIGDNDPAGGNVNTRKGYSQFLVEYLG